MIKPGGKSLHSLSLQNEGFAVYKVATKHYNLISNDGANISNIFNILAILQIWSEEMNNLTDELLSIINLEKWLKIYLN